MFDIALLNPILYYPYISSCERINTYSVNIQLYVKVQTAVIRNTIVIKYFIDENKLINNTVIRSQIIFDFKRWSIKVLKLCTMFVEWLIYLSSTYRNMHRYQRMHVKA